MIYLLATSQAGLYVETPESYASWIVCYERDWYFTPMKWKCTYPIDCHDMANTQDSYEMKYYIVTLVNNYLIRSKRK